MAYIYMFSILCNSELDAKRIQFFLASKDENTTEVNGLDCSIDTEIHDQAYIGSGEFDQKSIDAYSKEHWVSIIPSKEGRPLWASGMPTDKQEINKIKSFENKMLNMISFWPHQLKFLYASGGIEVTGFRNKKEIIELVQYDDLNLKNTIISIEIWNSAPLEWRDSTPAHRWVRINDNYLQFKE